LGGSVIKNFHYKKALQLNKLQGFFHFPKQEKKYILAAVWYISLKNPIL
jgi:hypothetical protein